VTRGPGRRGRNLFCRSRPWGRSPGSGNPRPRRGSVSGSGKNPQPGKQAEWIRSAHEFGRVLANQAPSRNSPGSQAGRPTALLWENLHSRVLWSNCISHQRFLFSWKPIV